MIRFSGSCMFYDSFLTDVTKPERMDEVSTWGFAMGYIGGSTIPFLISIGIMIAMKMSELSMRIAVLIVPVWWLVFSIPFMKNVRQESWVESESKNIARQAWKNTIGTFRSIFKIKAIFFFLLAYFFYIDGVGTIISISTAYGTVLGLGTVGMILALLVTQIVAMPCSILFANLAAKITARKALIIAIIIYTLICVVGFYMGFSLEPHQDAYQTALNEDYTEKLSDLTEEKAIALRDDASAFFRTAVTMEQP